MKKRYSFRFDFPDRKGINPSFEWLHLISIRYSSRTPQTGLMLRCDAEVIVFRECERRFVVQPEDEICLLNAISFLDLNLTGGIDFQARHFSGERLSGFSFRARPDYEIGWLLDQQVSEWPALDHAAVISRYPNCGLRRNPLLVHLFLRQDVIGGAALKDDERNCHEAAT